jgi:siroheme synthase
MATRATQSHAAEELTPPALVVIGDVVRISALLGSQYEMIAVHA